MQKYLAVCLVLSVMSLSVPISAEEEQNFGKQPQESGDGTKEDGQKISEKEIGRGIGKAGQDGSREPEDVPEPAPDPRVSGRKAFVRVYCPAFHATIKNIKHLFLDLDKAEHAEHKGYSKMVINWDGERSAGEKKVFDEISDCTHIKPGLGIGKSGKPTEDWFVNNDRIVYMKPGYYVNQKKAYEDNDGRKEHLDMPGPKATDNKKPNNVKDAKRESRLREISRQRKSPEESQKILDKEFGPKK